MENQASGDLTTQPSTSASDDAKVSSSSGPHQIFRPIDFENAESEETSESGSNTPTDSAYSSDNHQSAISQSSALPFRRITASLQNKALWKTFKRMGNEMIVTKPGRSA